MVMKTVKKDEIPKELKGEKVSYPVEVENVYLEMKRYSKS